MTYNVFIRGIYSTSLTKIFRDAGYNIIFPSTEIIKRFPDLEEFSGKYSKDIIINDRYDREGISITVKKELWEDIKNNFPINHNSFPNAIKLEAKFPLNSIHKGIVIQSNRMKNYSIVRLMPTQENDNNLSEHFSTTLGRMNKSLRVGSENIFQVVFEDVGKNYAFLNRGYTVSGDLAVIMPRNKRAFISKKIKDKEQRTKLNNVIKKVGISEFGILLRTAAKYATEIEILKEIHLLREKSLKIESQINQKSGTIGQIGGEFFSFNYLFPSLSKMRFDEIRSSIVPSVAFHHEIKACIGEKSENRQQFKVLNLIEKVMMELGAKEFSETINREYLSFYFNNLYIPKQFLYINHYKLNGRNLSLRPGIIKKIERIRTEDSDCLKIILRRKLAGKGLYDGLDIPIEEGDYAIGIYESGKMYCETIYYSKENELKGKYFNVNTPIMLRPDGIHYFDLEIDVIEPLRKSRTIIDIDYLEKAHEIGVISESLKNDAIMIAEKIKSGEIESELEKRTTGK